MSSRRRFENSHVYAPMDVGPEAYYEGGGTEQGGYGITTDVSKASKSGGGLLTFLDYMVGGFEKEDYEASPTAGGIDTRTGKPMDPEAARSVIESIGKPDYNPYDDYDPNAPPKKPDVKKLAIVAGSLVGAFALWKFVVEPRLGKKAE
jgi:hypothetical protein